MKVSCAAELSSTYSSRRHLCEMARPGANDDQPDCSQVAGFATEAFGLGSRIAPRVSFSYLTVVLPSGKNGL